MSRLPTSDSPEDPNAQNSRGRYFSRGRCFARKAPRISNVTGYQRSFVTKREQSMKAVFLRCHKMLRQLVCKINYGDEGCNRRQIFGNHSERSYCILLSIIYHWIKYAQRSRCSCTFGYASFGIPQCISSGTIGDTGGLSVYEALNLFALLDNYKQPSLTCAIRVGLHFILAFLLF